MAHTFAIVNQKGGVGKTTTALHVGIGLARQGKKVLLVDFDPQANLTISLGYRDAETLSPTIAELLLNTINDEPQPEGFGILHHEENVDLIPCSIQLANLEMTLYNAIQREFILKKFLSEVQNQYDYIVIDCIPSLGMLTINSLSASDSVIIPVQQHYLSIKGLEQLLNSISKVKKHLNPPLHIDGVLLTMVDYRSNFKREISQLLRESFGNTVPIFDAEIPNSVRVLETCAEGRSIFVSDPNGKVAAAYANLVKEITHNGQEI